MPSRIIAVNPRPNGVVMWTMARKLELCEKLQFGGYIDNDGVDNLIAWGNAVDFELFQSMLYN